MRALLAPIIGIFVATVLNLSAWAGDVFVAEDGALPKARVGQYEIIFRRNGAFVVRRDGVVLGDGGLGFATPQWREWGTQVRRSHHRDEWSVSDGGKELTFRGTLHNTECQERFKVTQKVSVIPNGLRFRYRVVPLRMQPLDVLGLVWHLPVSDMRGAHLRFGARKVAVSLPATHTKSVVQTALSPELFLQHPSGDSVTIKRDKSVQWMVFDDREWNLNTFRIVGNLRDLLAGASKGAIVEFDVDLLLLLEAPKGSADAAGPKATSAPLLADRAVGDPLVVPLPDDTFTQGDWLGSYGTFAYYLCAKRSPHSLHGGKGWPWQVAFSTGDPKEPRRAWRSSMPTDGDHSVLLDPNGQDRTAAAHDDHGEVRAPGMGPDLHINTAIPPGPYVLSMYFFEIDWPQYRAYRIHLIDKASGRVVCKATADHFVTGVYKRFLVAGPLDLKIVIGRGDSPNAQVSGLFLDEVTVPEPLLFDCVAAGTPYEPPRYSQDDISVEDALDAARVSFGSLEKNGFAAGYSATFLLRERAALDAARSLLGAAPRYYVSKWPSFWPDSLVRLARVAKSSAEGDGRLAACALRYATARASYDFETAWQCANAMATYLRKRIDANGPDRERYLVLSDAITRCLLRTGRRNEAMPVLRAYCATWSDTATPDVTKARLIDIGRLALKAGVAKPVARALSELHMTYQSLVPAERLLAANLHYAAGQHIEALRLYKTVESDLKPGRQHQWLLIAMLTCCLRGDDVDGAELCLTKMRAKYPGDKMIDEAQFRFGEYYYRERLWGAARNAFEGIKASSPTGLYDGMCDEYLRRIAHQEHIATAKD